MTNASARGLVWPRPVIPWTAGGLMRERNARKTMPEEQAADRELLARIASGDGNALRALYGIHGSRLYSLAFRITGNRAAAEDAVQESLVAVWENAGRFRGEGRVIAWLLGVVHHKAVDSVRGRALSSLEDETKEIAASSPSPEETFFRGERKDRIKAGFERLSGKHRLVLDLVFYQGLTLAEAAEVCACPLGTIKSRLSQAKAALKDFLNDGGFPENAR